MAKETLGAHLRNLLTPYKNLLQLVKDGKIDEETIRTYNLDNLDELIAFSNSEAMEQNHNQEPASEDLQQASREWLTPQLDKSYANYGERKMMELTHFDGYAMLDAIEFGAQWHKEQMMKGAIEGEVKTLYRHIVYVESVGFDSGSIRENKQSVFAGDKVKIIIVKDND